MFDKSYSGYVSLFDFEDALAQLNVVMNMDIIKKVFKHFDHDKDGKLTYLEFCNMICPKKNE